MEQDTTVTDEELESLCEKTGIHFDVISGLYGAAAGKHPKVPWDDVAEALERFARKFYGIWDINQVFAEAMLRLAIEPYTTNKYTHSVYYFGHDYHVMVEVARRINIGWFERFKQPPP